MDHSRAYEYEEFVSQLSQNQSFGGSRQVSLVLANTPMLKWLSAPNMYKKNGYIYNIFFTACPSGV